MRGRIDQPTPPTGADETITSPQIPVQSGWRFVGGTEVGKARSDSLERINRGDVEGLRVTR